MLLNNARVQIFEEFIRDYEVRLTGSYIAKKRNHNQKSVANALKEFEEEGFLKSTTQGKNKLYFLNLDDAQMAVHFISALEYLRTINFYKKQPFIKEIAKNILPHCRGVVAIFGSYAKGAPKKDSDLDIFVAGEYNSKEIDMISEAYKIEINVKHYRMTVFKKALIKKDLFLEEVIKDHILIENVQQFVSYVREFRYGKD